MMNRAVVWTFFWWQEGQNQRLLHEKASRYSMLAMGRQRDSRESALQVATVQNL